MEVQAELELYEHGVGAFADLQSAKQSAGKRKAMSSRNGLMSATMLSSHWARLSAKALRATTYLGAAMYSCAAASAFAQAPTSTPASADVQEVVVTGSRVATNGFVAPTPVTVLGPADIARNAPMNIADFVNELPQFSNSPSSHNSGDSVSDGNAGVNNLSLRALGAARTLVLLDGVRVVPSSITGFYNNGGAVDTNPFPDELVKSVDVVTGGASAVYGSDAISGAVNFVLDTKFTGLKGEISGSTTGYGDDDTGRYSLTGGTGFADNRGHLLFSGTYEHNDGILLNTKRTWLTNNNYYNINNPNYTATNGQPYILQLDNVGSAQYTPGGLITSSGALHGIDFGAGGSTRAFNFGSFNNGAYFSGGDWKETEGAINVSTSPTVSLDPELTRKNLFFRGSYDLTDHIQVYGQFMYALTDTFSYSGDVTAANITIQSGNPFIPASVQALLPKGGSFTMAENLSGTLGLVATSTERTFAQYLGGAKGDFQALNTDWKWNAYYTLSTSQLSANAGNNLNKTNFALATNVVTNPANGQPICASTLTNPTNGCVPYNPMGLGVNSQAAINYITGTSHLNQFLAQNEELATVSGEPLSTWAGPVSMAFGVENRRQYVTGSSPLLDQQNAWFIGNYHGSDGSVESTEGFFETLIPLAKDLPWAKQFSINGAIRETDYSTSGAVTTWKVGGTYSPVSDWLIRATRSHDIRAPDLGELFSAGQAATQNVSDPAKGGATVSIVGISTGNPNLTPEISDTVSAGVVYQPSWFPGLSASVDYYNIDITNAIIGVSGTTELNDCYIGLTTYCQFIKRDGNGNLTNIYTEPANAEFLKEDGLDIEASYKKSLPVFGMPGSLSIRGLASRVFHITVQQLGGLITEGAGVDAGGGYSTPFWRYNMTIAYDTKDWTVAWTGRGFSAGVYNNNYIQCTSNCPAYSVTYPTVSNNQMPGEFYMDLNLTYRPKFWSSSEELFLTISNLADNVPNNVAFLGFVPGDYDMLGRTFRAGIRFKY